MSDKRADAVVAGDRVRQQASVAEYRKVLGRSRTRDTIRLWLEDPAHKGQPLSAPLEVPTGSYLDVEVTVPA